jgi:hypothetical protein
MSEPICSNCKFFRVTTTIAPIKGECHYNPPLSGSLFQQGTNVSTRVAVWPMVRDIDFCAKFEAGKPPDVPQESHKTVVNVT